MIRYEQHINQKFTPSMFIFAFLFIQNFFAAQETPNWKETILNIYRDNYFQSCDIKKQIEICASLQLFNICAFAESHDLNRPKEIVERKLVLKEKYQKVQFITDLIVISTYEMFKDFKKTFESSNTANSISSVISSTLKKYITFTTVHNMALIILDYRLLDKKVLNRLTKKFKFPVNLMNGTMDLKTIYDALKEKINKMNADNDAIKYLNQRLDTLKFLTEREYGTEEDLQKIILSN